jgi:hypothetical protein
MVGYKLFVEGGGNTNALRTACRSGFTEFLKKAGLTGKMPRVVSCGSRKEAYDDFCTAIQHGETAFLLVDSEDLVNAQHQNKPWQHLEQRQGDGWAQPANTKDEHCHLMVACMESWFLADSAQLAVFFGQGFNANALPPTGRALESIPKTDVYNVLASASSRCKTKDCYGKGEHSFKILAQIAPDKVCAASPWAQRFINALKTV